MQLSKKSWHYKLYKLCYGKWANEPTNLCPYFWKRLLWAILFIIPIAVIELLLIIFFFILDKINKDNDNELVEEGLIGVALFAGIVSWIVSYLLFCMVYMWFITWMYQNSEGTYVIKNCIIRGLIGWTVTLIILIRWGILSLKAAYIKRKRKDNKEYIPQVEEPNIIVEAIRAWYEKHCPQITWKD